MDYELCDGCILSRVSFYFIQELCLSLYRGYGMFYDAWHATYATMMIVVSSLLRVHR